MKAIHFLRKSNIYIAVKYKKRLTVFLYPKGGKAMSFPLKIP